MFDLGNIYLEISIYALSKEFIHLMISYDLIDLEFGGFVAELIIN